MCAWKKILIDHKLVSLVVDERENLWFREDEMAKFCGFKSFDGYKEFCKFDAKWSSDAKSLCGNHESFSIIKFENPRLVRDCWVSNFAAKFDKALGPDKTKKVNDLMGKLNADHYDQHTNIFNKETYCKY